MRLPDAGRLLVTESKPPGVFCVPGTGSGVISRHANNLRDDNQEGTDAGAAKNEGNREEDHKAANGVRIAATGRNLLVLFAKFASGNKFFPFPGDVLLKLPRHHEYGSLDFLAAASALPGWPTQFFTIFHPDCRHLDSIDLTVLSGNFRFDLENGPIVHPSRPFATP